MKSRIQHQLQWLRQRGRRRHGRKAFHSRARTSLHQVRRRFLKRRPSAASSHQLKAEPGVSWRILKTHRRRSCSLSSKRWRAQIWTSATSHSESSSCRVQQKASNQRTRRTTSRMLRCTWSSAIIRRRSACTTWVRGARAYFRPLGPSSAVSSTSRIRRRLRRSHTCTPSPKTCTASSATTRRPSSSCRVPTVVARPPRRWLAHLWFTHSSCGSRRTLCRCSRSSGCRQTLNHRNCAICTTAPTSFEPICRTTSRSRWCRSTSAPCRGWRRLATAAGCTSKSLRMIVWWSARCRSTSEWGELDPKCIQCRLIEGTFFQALPRVRRQN